MPEWRTTRRCYSVPTANVVGATASLLLEIDEAQDVDPEKYERDFRPMASSTNATTVLYGTAWSDDSILERQRRINQEQDRRARERGTPERLHFEYDWQVLAAIEPRYGAFVEAEIARLGAEHPSIQTQYLLQCVGDAGRLFSMEQRTLLQGTHPRQRLPQPGAVYVAGIDVAGEDEQDPTGQSLGAAAPAQPGSRDATVITIAEVDRDPAGSPVVQVVDHVWWTGRGQVWQYENLLDLWERWSFARVCVDASGIGAGLADFLAAQHPERVEKFVFSAPSKSRLAYAMLATINTGRLQAYAPDHSKEFREFWREVAACRYWLRAGEIMGWGVPESEGHDDFVVSLALACRAADELTVPAAGGLIRARPDEDWTAW